MTNCDKPEKQKMMKYTRIYSVFLILVFCTFCKGQNKTDLPNDDIKPKNNGLIAADSIAIKNKNWIKQSKTKDNKLTGLYSETANNGIIIQNSLPKGGTYADPAGKIFGYRILWTRVINKTSTPIEIAISFPADSLAILPLPTSYLRLFLPPGTMTPDKVSLYDYGVTRLKSFLDTGLNKPTRLQKTIYPQEEYIFYIGALLHSGGLLRGELVLKDKDLFYRVGISPDFDPESFPCGHIIYKK